MVDQALKDFIRRYVQYYSADQVKESLLRKGWNEQDIDEAFKELQEEAPVPDSDVPLPGSETQGGQAQQTESPLLELKPRIIAGILPVYIVTVAIVVMMFLFFNPVTLLSTYLRLDPFLSVFITTSSIMSLSVIISFLRLKTRQYAFFSDRSEFYGGFIRLKKDILRYDMISGIFLKRTAWHKLWGIGTIIFRVALPMNKELKISYVVDSETVFKDLQELVQRFSKKDEQPDYSGLLEGQFNQGLVEMP